MKKPNFRRKLKTQLECYTANMGNDHIIKLKDGRRLGYSEYGDPKGKPFFYFHGWPVSRLSAKITNDAAKKLHIRVIAPDRPGYGLSDFKKNRTLLDFPNDIVELADKLGIKKFAVMGQSGGGPYAAVCAYKIPERLNSVGIVVGLAPTYVPGLLDGITWIARVGWVNYPRMAFLRFMGAYLHYFRTRYLPSFGLHRFMFGAKADKAIYADAKVRNEVKKSYQEAFRQGYKGVEQDLEIYTKDWGFKLSEIKAIVYLFYGEDDKNVSIKMGQYYANQIKGSKLITYPREGHLVSRTHAEEILKTLIV